MTFSFYRKKALSPGCSVVLQLVLLLSNFFLMEVERRSCTFVSRNQEDFETNVNPFLSEPPQLQMTVTYDKQGATKFPIILCSENRLPCSWERSVISKNWKRSSQEWTGKWTRNETHRKMAGGRQCVRGGGRTNTWTNFSPAAFRPVVDLTSLQPVWNLQPHSQSGSFAGVQTPAE